MTRTFGIDGGGVIFFLSYATVQDKKLAMELKKDVEAYGKGNTVLYDRNDIRKGQDTDAVINALIAKADAVLFLVSVSSIRSFWCGKEVGLAQALGKPIIPVVAPHIPMDFVKQNSVQAVSILKAVFWGEEDKIKKIVEGLNYERRMVGVQGLFVQSSTLEEFRRPENLGIRLENTRDFDLFDVSIFVQLSMSSKTGKTAAHFELKQDARIALLAAGQVYRQSFGLSEFTKLDSAGFAARLKVDANMSSVARVILKYSPGGSMYHRQVEQVPICEMLSKNYIDKIGDKFLKLALRRKKRQLEMERVVKNG